MVGHKRSCAQSDLETGTSLMSYWGATQSPCSHILLGECEHITGVAAFPSST